MSHTSLSRTALLVVLAGSLGAGALRAQAPQTVESPGGITGEGYALLVGVRQYSEAKELRPLPYSENDIVDLAKVLQDNGYRKENVVLMTQTVGAETLRYLPLKARILKELRLLLQGRKATDTVLVALAGHGVHFKDDATSYFCPADADLHDRKTLLALPEVYRELEQCPAGVKVLLVDACRNDPLLERTRAADLDVESVTRPALPAPPGGVVAFFSCSENEKAYEDDKLKHGVFFHFVIEGLQGRASGDSDDVTLAALADYVNRRVESFVRSEYAASQTPEMLGKSRGSMTLLRLDPALRHVRRGRDYQHAYEPARAIEEFSEAIRLNPKLALAYAGRAEAYNDQGEYDRALADANTALALDPKLTAAYLARASVWCWRKKQYDRAIEDCTEAIRLDPRSAGAYAARAHAYNQKGEYDKAFADCREALRLDPKLTDAYHAQADTYTYQGEYDRAIVVCTEAIRLDPKDPELYSHRAYIYNKQGKYAEVIQDSTEGIHLAPRLADLYLHRAGAYSKKGQYDRAIEDYTAALRLNPKMAWVYSARGDTYVEKQDYDRAIADYNEAIRLDPTDASAFHSRGAAYAWKDDWGQAIRDYTEAIRLDPKNASVHRDRAAAYDRLGDQVRAQADRDTAAQLERNK